MCMHFPHLSMTMCTIIPYLALALMDCMLCTAVVAGVHLHKTTHSLWGDSNRHNAYWYINDYMKLTAIFTVSYHHIRSNDMYICTAHYIQLSLSPHVFSHILTPRRHVLCALIIQWYRVMMCVTMCQHTRPSWHWMGQVVYCGTVVCGGCDSVVSPVHGMKYNYVCGRAVGYSFNAPIGLFYGAEWPVHHTWDTRQMQSHLELCSWMEGGLS